MPPEPVAATRREADRFVDTIMYTMFAPLIVFPGWEDSFKDHKMEAIAHRMAHQQEVFDRQECTEYEAMLYVSSASLVAPPEHDWVQVYLWLFQRYKPEFAEANDLKPDRAELNAQQREKLTGLRRWVFRRQMEHMKAKNKDEKPPPKATPEKSKADNVKVVQERMF